MNQRNRILIGIAILILLAGAVLAIEALRGKSTSITEITIDPGDVPLYQNGKLVAAFNADDISEIEQVSFTDKEEGKVQQGWLVASVLDQLIKTKRLSDQTQVIFISSSRNKSATLSWGQIKVPENMVMFDLSGRGTLKLVSILEQLDTRDEWIQDVDKIEVIEP